MHCTVLLMPMRYSALLVLCAGSPLGTGGHFADDIANKILNVCDINDYIIGTFMYECLYVNISDIFRSYFQRNADVHDHNL